MFEKNKKKSQGNITYFFPLLYRIMHVCPLYFTFCVFLIYTKEIIIYSKSKHNYRNNNKTQKKPCHCIQWFLIQMKFLSAMG